MAWMILPGRTARSTALRNLMNSLWVWLGMQRPTTVPSRMLSGKQGGGAVALIIMGHGAAFAGLDGQAGLGAVERLDLRFLVDRDDDGMGGRVHVEADDIFDLFSEGWVGGRLESAEPVGLKTVRLPDALHGAQADAWRPGDHAARAMKGLC